MQLRNDHRALLQLEQMVADANKASPLLTDLGVVVTPCIRLLYQAFESDCYATTSPAGRHILEGLLSCLPDNKIIEDAHGVLRQSGKAQPNKRQTLHHLQETVTSSNVLSSRGIVHKSAVDRDTFIRCFPNTKDRKRKRPAMSEPVSSECLAFLYLLLNMIH